MAKTVIIDSSVSPSTSSVSRSASSISAEDAPQEQSGIMGLLGSTPASILANGVLSATIPGYGPANLGVMGLTGTSIYGQGVSLAPASSYPAASGRDFYGLIASIVDDAGKLLYQQCGPSMLAPQCVAEKPE